MAPANSGRRMNMKRLRKGFAALCLTAAALLAMMIGAGLPRIHRYSADAVDRLFPVSYQITYRNADARSVTAPVRFTADTAIVTAAPGGTGESIPLSDAVFVCLQSELRAQNMLRSGLLSAAVVSAAASLPITLAAIAFMAAVPRARSAKRRVPRVPRHPAAIRTRRTPTMPSVA